MRIALVVNEFNIRGGTHKQVHRLAEYLLSRGHNVGIYTKFYNPEFCYPGVEKLKIFAATNKNEHNKFRPIRYIISLISSLKLAIYVMRNSDVVNIHDNGLFFFWFFLRFLAPRMRVIWQLNDLPGCFNIGASTSNLPRFWQRAQRIAIKFMAARVNQITVNVTKNAIRVKENLHVNAEVFYCGVDNQNPERIFRKKIDSEVVNLVSTGVFFPYRNYESIIKAQQLLSVQYGINSKLTIIGSTNLAPDYAREILSLAETLKVNCEILGSVNQATLDFIYKNSDIFLFLNIDQSWGLAVFEAMNFGLPVIVSDSVGATELLIPNIDAEIVNPTDCVEIANSIRSLFLDSNLYKKRQKAGYESTLRMSWDEFYCKPMEHLLLSEKE